MPLVLCNLKVFLLTKNKRLASPHRVQLPTHRSWAHKVIFSSEPALSYLPFRMHYMISAVSWLHRVFLEFSTVTHVFLLFSFWGLSGFQILTNQEKIKPSQNLSFIIVCSGWYVKFSHIHGLRVKYDPNWKMSWVHLSHSYPHCRCVVFYSPHWVLSFVLLPRFHLGSLHTPQVDLQKYSLVCLLAFQYNDLPARITSA